MPVADSDRSSADILDGGAVRIRFLLSESRPTSFLDSQLARHRGLPWPRCHRRSSEIVWFDPFSLSANAVRKGNAGLPWPVADGETIVGDPCDLYQAGRFHDTPLLLGFNSNDGGLFGSPRRTPEDFEKSVRESFPANPDVIMAAYPHATPAEASRSARDLLRESLYGWPSWAWAN